METFSIRSFRPIEGKEDATDQDRTVLRLCEGFAPYPQGALCAGPEWKPLWDMDDLGETIETALAGADGTKAHFVKFVKNGHTFLVCWSLTAHRALGYFYAGGSDANQDFDTGGAVVMTATADAIWRGKNGTALWFASLVQGRVILGNGVDDNLVWYGGALALLGPAAAPADINKRAKIRIPACTCFRQHVNRSLFATGNAANPLRVWITDAPNMGETFVDAIYSLATSFIDVHPLNGATRTTALSVYQQYVTAHTDKGPINLYGVDNSSDGWKAQQSASAANASAINPSCMGDGIEGDASFYLGADLQVYFDQAVRSGPFEKRGSRDIDIATAQGANLWNRQAADVLQAYGYHTQYDRANRLFWMFMPNALDSRPALFVFNERTRTVAGPWRYPAAVVSCMLTSLGTSVVSIITAAGECLYARLGEIGELEPEDIEPKGTALGAAFEVAGAEPTPEAAVPFVAMPADHSAILEVVGDKVVGLDDMLGQMKVLDPDDFDDDLELVEFFNNAYVARFEAPWQDLGSPKQLKNFLEVQLSISRDSRAYVGIYAETDGGRDGSLRGGRWKGIVHGRNNVRVPLNLAGRKIRIRVVAVVFNAGRFLINDATIGYAVGGLD